MVDLAFPLLQMLWSVTAGVLLVNAVMMTRAVLTIGTIRGAASAIMSIFVMLIALVLIAQGAGFTQFALPSPGPVLYLELLVVLIPVGLTLFAVALVATSRGRRKFTPQESSEKIIKRGIAVRFVLATALTAISFLILGVSFFMPWIAIGSTSFTLSDLYAGFLGQSNIQKHLLRQLLAQVSSASVLADSFVAIALVMALFPICMLFTLASLYPKKTWLMSTGSILAIAASVLAVYSSLSLAGHLLGPVAFSASRITLDSGDSMALLAGGLLSLAYSEQILRSSARVTKAGEVGQIKKEFTGTLDHCPACGGRVDSGAWYCPKCGARMTLRV